MKESFNDRLTTGNYWDRKYRVTSENKTYTVNTKINLASIEVDRFFKEHLPRNESLSFIEIGCAPGLWMHYFHTNFGYRVDGIEYTKNGVELTRKNMRLLGIPTNIYEEDLFKNTIPKGTYDVVFSSGFIEHFTHPEEVVSKHVELLKSGGILIVKVPNLHGMNYLLQRMIDRNILKKHNLGMMNLGYFRMLQKKFDLEPIEIEYVGLINFALPSGNRFLLLVPYALQVILSLMYRSFCGWLPFRNGKNTSPYIIGIYRKR